MRCSVSEGPASFACVVFKLSLDIYFEKGCSCVCLKIFSKCGAPLFDIIAVCFKVG